MKYTLLLFFIFISCKELKQETAQPKNEFPLINWHEYNMYQANELPLRYNPLDHIRMVIRGGMGFPSYVLGFIKISENYLVYFKTEQDGTFKSEGQLLSGQDFNDKWLLIVNKLKEMKEPPKVKDGVEIYDGISWAIEMKTEGEYKYKSGKVLTLSDVEWVENLYALTPYKCDFLLPFKEGLQHQ